MSELFPPTSAETNSPLPTTPRPRWMPGLVLPLAYWILYESVKRTSDNNFVVFMTNFVGPLVTWLLFMIAWLGFSRRRWSERLSGLATFVVIGIVAALLAHDSMKVGLILYALPAVLLVWGIWGWVTRNQESITRRRVSLTLVMAVTTSYFCLLRLDGVDGGMQSALSWRWQPTAEERFLAVTPKPAAATSTKTSETDEPEIETTAEDWPGFRGGQRDSRVSKTSLNRDWSAHPPQVVWQHAVGPGWSSFAVIGDRLFTQEQRGEDECVTCYDANNGAELWCFRHASRFSDPVSGAGPRATPQFHQGRLFVQGALGHLWCLSAATGRLVWTANPAKDTNAPTPIWGFSGSPLVIDNVVVAVPGGPDASAIAYQSSDGTLAWKSAQGPSGYYSAHRVDLQGTAQVAVLTNQGAFGIEPSSGQRLWFHDWNSNEEMRIAQPMVVGSSQLLIPTGQSSGARLIEVTQDNNAWQTKEVWTSRECRPYFNDYVQHSEHAFGFDGPLFCCIDLKTGKRRWKKGRYGNGQALLLSEQGLLLVLSETGDIVLLEANPQAHVELGRQTVLSGKTWNHPVLVRDRLFVRNGEQIACLKLAQQASSETP